MGYLPFDTALELRRLQFMEKISKSQPAPANYVYKWFGAEEFRYLKAKLNIQPDVHSTCWKNVIWSNFREKKSKIWQ